MKIYSWLQNNFFYILIFFFFLTINYLSTPIFDDWEVSMWFNNSNGNILSVLTHGIYYFWEYMNGRALTNVTMMVFTYFHSLWNIISAVIFVFIAIVFNNKIVNRNPKFTLPLTLFFLTSISSGIRMETYSYISAHIAFIFAFALTLLFYLSIKKQLLQKNSWLTLILFSLFAFIIASWVENLGIGFTAVLLFANLCFWFKNKRINPLLVLTFLASCLGLLFLFTSPGMRNVRDVYNETKGLFGTFKLSFPQNINLFLYQNKPIFAILSLLSFLLIKTNNIKVNNRFFTICYLILMIGISIVLIIPLIPPYLSGFNTLSIYINKYFFSGLINETIFWFIFILSFIIPIYYLKKNRKLAFFTYIYTIFSLLPLFFISQSGNRIIAVPVISYSMLAIIFATQIVIKKTEIWKATHYILIFAVFLRLVNWLYIYTSIKKVQTIRESIFKEVMISQSLQKWDYKNDIIRMPKFDSNQVLNSGVSKIGEFHYLPFLRYYHLNPDTQIIFE